MTRAARPADVRTKFRFAKIDPRADHTTAITPSSVTRVARAEVN